MVSAAQHPAFAGLARLLRFPFLREQVRWLPRMCSGPWEAVPWPGGRRQPQRHGAVFYKERACGPEPSRLYALCLWRGGDSEGPRSADQGARE